MTARGFQSVAITGGSGLIGRSVAERLTSKGHRAMSLSRASGLSGADDSEAAPATWNVNTGEIRTPGRIDALVHLAGRSVADRWSEKVRREVWDSRVPATEKLCSFLAKMPEAERPTRLVAASAIGIYGDRGDEVLTEDSPLAEKGKSFLADVCHGWEAATRAAEEAGIKVIHVRIGVVLAREGGALAKLATPTRLGLGGPVGKGTQFMPWISLTDLSRLLVYLATESDMTGVLNAVGPAPVRQHEFMRTLGKVLHRPTVFPLPGFMVKAVFGQMGEEMLLASMRVISNRMPAEFEFEHPTLEGAMRAELGIK